MIKIEKRIIEINEVQFQQELKDYIISFKKHIPNAYAIPFKEINSHFNTKLKFSEFITLSDLFNYRIFRGNSWVIDEILK